MTNSVKIKARIPSTKQQRGQTKNQWLRELEALAATAKNPDDVSAVSKKPLVSQWPSHLFPTISHTPSSQGTAALLMTLTLTYMLLGLRPQLR